MNNERRKEFILDDSSKGLTAWSLVPVDLEKRNMATGSCAGQQLTSQWTGSKEYNKNEFRDSYPPKTALIYLLSLVISHHPTVSQATEEKLDK